MCIEPPSSDLPSSCQLSSHQPPGPKASPDTALAGAQPEGTKWRKTEKASVKSEEEAEMSDHWRAGGGDGLCVTLQAGILERAVQGRACRGWLRI